MTNTVPKMRLIQDIYDELHRDDPDSAITMYALRQLVKTGKIPSMKIGRKTLINYFDVVAYFSNTPAITPEVNGIRRVG